MSYGTPTGRVVAGRQERADLLASLPDEALCAFIASKSRGADSTWLMIALDEGVLDPESLRRRMTESGASQAEMETAWAARAGAFMAVLDTARHDAVKSAQGVAHLVGRFELPAAFEPVIAPLFTQVLEGIRDWDRTRPVECFAAVQALQLAKVFAVMLDRPELVDLTEFGYGDNPLVKLAGMQGLFSKHQDLMVTPLFCAVQFNKRRSVDALLTELPQDELNFCDANKLSIPFHFAFSAVTLTAETDVLAKVLRFMRPCDPPAEDNDEPLTRAQEIWEVMLERVCDLGERVMRDEDSEALHHLPAFIEAGIFEESPLMAIREAVSSCQPSVIDHLAAQIPWYQTGDQNTFLADAGTIALDSGKVDGLVRLIDVARRCGTLELVLSSFTLAPEVGPTGIPTAPVLSWRSACSLVQSEGGSAVLAALIRAGVNPSMDVGPAVSRTTLRELAANTGVPSAQQILNSAAARDAVLTVLESRPHTQFSQPPPT